MNYEPVIGLEVHVQLKTKSKVFCGCSTEFGSEPNSQVCPVCLGFPGSLPVLNKLAFEYSIKVGLALNCEVQEYTKFDRKHYYYPDLPKNFQISQYDLPISKDGFLDIQAANGLKRIHIRRAHLEEDAGKLIHKDTVSLVDYNRTGQPLLEIVTEPDINTPEEAYEYLTDLKAIIQYLEVSDCDMEKGTLRCDANISLRPQGTTGLGTKSELKNLNSFKAVKEALHYEIGRHKQVLEDGQAVIQETRLWDEKAGRTLAMRSKEEAKDYRYFPEPDLPPIITPKVIIENIRQTIPELPKAKQARFVKEYGLTAATARTLTAVKKDSEYAEQVIKQYPGNDKKVPADWFINTAASTANALNCTVVDLNVPVNYYLEILDYRDKQLISNLTAKNVWDETVASKKAPSEIIKEKNLIQVSDESSLLKDIDAVICENPKVVADVKGGKENAAMFLVGQVMKKSKGKANPKVVLDILKRRLQNA